MTKVGDIFPSSYLRAEDIGRARPVVTIRVVAIEKIGDDQKPVLYFRDKDKGLVLNKTNAHMITEIAGTDEIERWAGVNIRLYATTTEFQGKRVPCLRVDHADAVAPPPPPEPGTDSDCPF